MTKVLEPEERARLRAPFFPRDVILYVSKRANTPVADILSPSRQKYYVRLRAVIAMVMHERGVSFPRIATFLNRDRSSIHNAIKTFHHTYKNNEYVQSLLSATRRQFLGEG